MLLYNLDEEGILAIGMRVRHAEKGLFRSVY